MYRIIGLSLCATLAACSGGSGGATSAAAPDAGSAPAPAAPAPAEPAPYDPGMASLKALASFPVGVAVAAGGERASLLSTPAQQAVVKTHFSQITAANIMKMSYLHPEPDTYTFAQADALVKFALENGMSVHGHTLVWHSEYQVPAFMKNFSGDKAAWLAMLDTHVRNVAGHFAGKVASWEVVNEALADGGGYRDSLFHRKMGTDYIGRAFSSARAADPEADLYYNDYNIESDAAKLKTLIEMLDGFKARGVPVTGVGFQMHVYMDTPSVATIAQAFRQVAERNLKVKITELDIPLNNPYGSAYWAGDVKSSYTLALGLAQKKRYCEVVKAYMDSVPAHLRGGVSVWGVDDPGSWLIQQLFSGRHQDWPLLFDAQYRAKPALRGVADGLTGKACSAT